jgi:hypothetical protein
MVVKMRSVVVIGAIWLATVAGVSATAWVAIDRAGRDITGGAVTSLPSVTVGTAATSAGGSSPTKPTSQTSTSQAPSATLKPSATNAPSTTQGPSASPEPPAAPSSATRAGSSTWQDRTVSVTGGQVSVRCIGATILLRIAQPQDGWRVEVGDSARAKVAVSFRRGDEEGWIGTKVTAVCAQGTPAFSVNNND